MPSISIPKLSDETIYLLQTQAKIHGVSVEEEVRQIIVRDVSSPEALGDMAVKLFGPAYIEDNHDFKLPERKTYDPIEFK